MRVRLMGKLIIWSLIGGRDEGGVSERGLLREERDDEQGGSSVALSDRGCVDWEWDVRIAMIYACYDIFPSAGFPSLE